MSSIGERIRLIRKKKNLSQKEFASMIGISQNHLSEIETSKAGVSTRVLFAISDKFEDVNRDWLLTGESVMDKETISDNDDPIPALMVKLLKNLTEEQQRKIGEAMLRKEEVEELNREVERLERRIRELKFGQ